MAAIPLIIHLVHGTWPCGPWAQKRWDLLRNGTLDRDRFWGELLRNHTRARHRFWFLEGSSFCRHIKRCFCRDIERSANSSIKFVTFTWSGTNSFKARHKAATDVHKHLEDSLRVNSNAYHVVVAHSHGGTVAFEAITNPPLQQSLAGVVTMGTPFVALRKSSSWRAERVARFVALGWGAALTICLGMASAVALTLGTEWFRSTFALFIAIVCFMVLVTQWTSLIDWLKPPRGLHDLLAPTDPKLECPLIAYRAPGDEASLAISAVQFTDWFVSRIVLGEIIRRPIACLQRMIKTCGAWLSVITTWTMTSSAYWLFTEELQPLWVYLIAGPAHLMLFSLVLFMVVPLILLRGMLMLSLATGPEALRYAGYATVDAESVPVGISANIEMLRLSDDKRHTMALRHSLHELPVMREQIAEWLRLHCT